VVRYKSGHRDTTHAAIVAAASTLLRDNGFTDTSVALVMKAVGLTHGGFYAHFPDKTAMIIAAVDEAFVESPKNFATLARIANAKHDAGFIADKYLDDERVQKIATGCPAAALVSELPRQPEPVQRAFQAGATATARELAKADGLGSDANPEAWAALAMLMGALSLMRAVPDQQTRQSIRSQVTAALRHLAAAASAPTKDADKTT
jgi:TetR/AcrR family transcriptional regulator, transcriptional repressor for nem operon